MNLDETIEKITKEVLNKIQGSNINIPSMSGSANRKNILVILTGSDWQINKVFTYLKMLSTTNNLTFILSKSAEKIIGGARVQAEFSNPKIIFSSDSYKAKDLTNQFDIIIAPTMTLTTISKLSNLIGDNLITNILIQGLISNKSIVATKDTLLHDGMETTLSFQHTINSYINRVSSYGVIVVNVDDLYSLNLDSLVKTGSHFTGETFYKTMLSKCSADSLECSACGLCISRTPERVKEIVDSGAARVSSSVGVKNVASNIARYIDHTLLKPDVKEEQIKKLCEEAKEYQFASVCVNPGWVKLSAELLKGTPVKVCTVVGFPLGATSTEAKVAETIQAIKDGADEIDMVINVGALKSGKFDFVREDIRRVKQACGNILLKVILETCLLTDDEKIKACELSKEAGADYVKTSTGFGSGGATAADIALMRSVVGPSMGVKASGGIKNAKIAQEMLRFGATRIGASASVEIVKGLTSKSDY